MLDETELAALIAENPGFTFVGRSWNKRMSQFDPPVVLYEPSGG